MMMRRCICIPFLLSFVLNGLKDSPDKAHGLPGQPEYKDTPYLQDYSIKYEIKKLKEAGSILLKKVYCDRNGVVQVFSSGGLLALSGGKLLYPGELVHDVSY